MSQLRSIKQLILIPLQAYGWVWLFVFTGLILGLILIIAELSFIYSVLSTDMPTSLLWELMMAFMQGDTIYPRGHFLLIALLGGVYLTVIRYLVTHIKKISSRSIVTSVLGYAGVSIGLSCIGCGAAYIVLLLSLFGASGSLVLIASAQPYLLLAGELALLASIILAYRSLRRLEHV